MNLESSPLPSKPILLLMGTLFLWSCSPQDISPIPAGSTQLILVVSDSLQASTGSLTRFTREPGGTWQQTDSPVVIVLGRNGLAWGRGLHELNATMQPVKVEGDGCAPAGVFTLSTAFGYTHPDSMIGLKFPYIHNNEFLECVDDIDSEYYARVVYNDDVDSVDWTSSERMGHYGVWYAQGVVVEHNLDPVISGAGSCIFLHNWSTPDETTSGCTEMEPKSLSELILWLDEVQNPVLVQLPLEWYLSSRSRWQLPQIDYSKGEQ